MNAALNIEERNRENLDPSANFNRGAKLLDPNFNQRYQSGNKEPPSDRIKARQLETDYMEQMESIKKY